MSQEFCSLGQSDVTDIVRSRLVGEFLELTIEMYSAQSYLRSKIFGGEIRVVQIIVDALYKALEQLLIGRQNLRCRNLVCWKFVALECVAQFLLTK